MDTLKYDFMCQYEEKDSIGKRYRRHDAEGQKLDEEEKPLAMEGGLSDGI